MSTSSCALKSATRAVAFCAMSEKSLSWRTPASPKDNATVANSWQLAVYTCGVICAAMPRNKVTSDCWEAAKAQASITKQRKENCSKRSPMYAAATWKKGPLHPWISGLISPNFAKPHNKDESSKGFKSEMCDEASSMILLIDGSSAILTVANDHAMLLNAWHCGGAPPVPACCSDCRRVPIKLVRTGCWCKLAIASASEIAILARRCNAVDRFTRFICVKYASTVDMNSSRSPVSAEAMIWLLMSGKVRRRAACRARARVRSPRRWARPWVCTWSWASWATCVIEPSCKQSLHFKGNLDK
mmetsp:Transcript_95969/g.248561  ORF Transcript_95969/g.248561 Transcript_95969/m.248561 type:complete len:301 (+) Transcript_95969:1493-2395(+)